MTHFLACENCENTLMIEDDDILFEDTIKAWNCTGRQICPECDDEKTIIPVRPNFYFNTQTIPDVPLSPKSVTAPVHDHPYVIITCEGEQEYE